VVADPQAIDIADAYLAIDRETFEARAALWALVVSEAAHRRGEAPRPDRMMMARMGAGLGIRPSDIEEWVDAADKIAALQNEPAGEAQAAEALAAARARKYGATEICKELTALTTKISTEADRDFRRTSAARGAAETARLALRDCAPPFLRDEYAAAQRELYDAQNRHAQAILATAAVDDRASDIDADQWRQFVDNVVRRDDRDSYDGWSALVTQHDERFSRGDEAGRQEVVGQMAALRAEIIAESPTEWNAWVRDSRQLTEIRYQQSAAKGREAAAAASLAAAQEHHARVEAMVRQVIPLMPSPTTGTAAPPNPLACVVDSWRRVLGEVQERLTTAETALARSREPDADDEDAADGVAVP